MLRSCEGEEGAGGRGRAIGEEDRSARSARDRGKESGGRGELDSRAWCHFWVANARGRPRATHRRVGARAGERAPRVRSRVSMRSGSTHLGTLSSSSGRSSAITPALCMGSIFCGRVASSATVCTKATLSFWYFSNTWSTARVDAIVLDRKERARVRENPGHRRARNDALARGFLLQNRIRGNLKSTMESSKLKPDWVKTRCGVGRFSFEMLGKYRSKSVFSRSKNEKGKSV